MRGVVCQPRADDRVLVSPIVVHDEVEVLGGIHTGQSLQKPQELFMAVARVAASRHLAGGNVESCEERRRAVANIVVAAPFDLAGSHGQQRLGPVQCLDLTLLIDAQDHCFFGWMQVETNDVGDLVHEVGIRAELEAAGAMGLQTVILPDSKHGAVADAEPRPEQARAPMCAAVLRRFHRRRHKAVHEVAGQLRLLAASAGFLEALHAGFAEAPTPSPHGQTIASQALSDDIAGDAVSGEQHNLRPQHLTMGQRSAARPHLQRSALFGRRQ